MKAAFVFSGNIVPLNYNAKTELAAEIIEASHTFDFALQSS